MPKMIISLDGVVLREVQLTKDRVTLGRRPYNDIVIDHLAVSGEHALVQVLGRETFIEDLNSTNGTYINGKTVKKQLLKNGDVIEIGKYRIQYVDEAGTVGYSSSVAPGLGWWASRLAPRAGPRRLSGAGQTRDDHWQARCDHFHHHQKPRRLCHCASRRRQPACS